MRSKISFMVGVKVRGSENENLKPHKAASEVSIRQYENLIYLIWRTDHKNEILSVERLPKLVVLYLYIFII